MNCAVYPVLLPLVTALCFLLWSQPSFWRRFVAALSMGVQVMIAFFFLLQTQQGTTEVLLVGGWAAPFGIALVIDRLAAVMLFAASITVFAGVLWGFGEQSVEKEHALRLPLIQFLWMGVSLSMITGDFFNLFVAFEVMLMASYALLTLEIDVEKIQYALPYLLMNLVGSALFLCAVAMVYGYLGTLNFAHLSLLLEGRGADPHLLVLGLVFLCVFGLKAGVFPLYFWLPQSYPTLPVPLAAIFGGVLTKVGIYVLIRLLVTVLPPGLHVLYTLLLVLSGITMLLGVLGAISRHRIKEILSYHIVSQIGFMVLAIGLFTPLSIAAAIIYTVHNIVVKASLFLYGGIGQMYYGTDNLKKMGYLWHVAPFAGFCFMVQAFSLAGVPPLSGFWGKYLIVREGLMQGQFVLTGIAIFTGWLTLFSMLKIWLGAFWGKCKDGLNEKGVHRKGLTVAGLVLVVVAIGMGLFAETTVRVAEAAATQLFDRNQYRESVFTVGGKGEAL